MNIYKIFTRGCILLYSPFICAQWGIVKVPVANAIMTQAPGIYDESSIATFYRNIPLSVEAGGYPRAHQLLFNEKVEVIRTTPLELLVNLKTVVFETSDVTRGVQSRVWVLREDIALDDESHLPGLTHYSFPPPLYEACNDDVIVLLLPWQCPQTQHIYSAGTRFVHDKKNDTLCSYGIALRDWQHKKQVYTLVPKSLSRIESRATKKNAQNRFIHLLRLWLMQAGDRCIPYVWGGSSLVHFYDSTPPFEKIMIGEGEYQRKETHRPHTGFDCSEMILRAAQICGIPYFYKTSSLIAKYLPQVSIHEAVREGDIIWYPGHVMVVSDAKEHKMIEARGYANGYGKIHEVSLNTIFHDITSYDQLLSWSH